MKKILTTLGIATMLFVTGCSANNAQTTQDQPQQTEQTSGKPITEPTGTRSEPLWLEDESYSSSSPLNGTFKKRLEDGRVITCVWVQNYGIDCDWATAKVESENTQYN